MQEVAGLAAAVGRNFTLDLLTEASDLDADTVVRAVDELWRRRIVRELRDGYDFSHDLLRDAAYAQISPPKRWLLHRRLAQGLELLHANDTDAVSAQLAEQYARGGRPERALAYYRRAAEVASDEVRPRRGDPAVRSSVVDRAHASRRQRPGPPGARVARGDVGAAQCPVWLLLPQAPTDADPLDRAGRGARPRRLLARCADRIVVLAVRPGKPGRRARYRDAGAGNGRGRL